MYNITYILYFTCIHVEQKERLTRKGILYNKDRFFSVILSYILFNYVYIPFFFRDLDREK